MGSADSDSVVSGELGRSEAQRQALGSLLARFTSDRDAMIASIQGCEEQIAALAERLEGGNANRQSEEDQAPCVADEAGATAPILEQLRSEQQQAVAQVRAEAGHAMERADEALRRLVQLTESQEEHVGIAGEVAALRKTAERLAADLVRLQRATEERVESLARSTATVAERFETIAGAVDRVPRLEEEMKRMHASLDEVAEAMRKRPAASEASEQAHSAALGDLRKQVAALKSVALCGSGLRNVWLTLILAVLVTVIGFAASSFG